MNLIEGLQAEMNRVRKVIAVYESPELKGAGMFAAEGMKEDIRQAEAAIASGDVVEMMRLLSLLKEWESVE